MTFPIGYQLPEAQDLMTLCAISYCYDHTGYTYDQIETAIVGQLKDHASDWSLVWLGMTTDLGNLAYVARDNREAARVAVVMRGSAWDFADDYIEDFDVFEQFSWPTTATQYPNRKISGGALDGLKTILSLHGGSPTSSEELAATKSSVLETGFAPSGESGTISDPRTLSLKDFLATLPASYAASQDGASDTSGAPLPMVDIFIAGHSLGGALATVCGLWMQEQVASWPKNQGIVNLKSYTFAAPSAGNQDFVDYYNSRATAYPLTWGAFRVFNQQDLVPYAWADLLGVLFSGIPMCKTLEIEVGGTLGLVDAGLIKYNCMYAQVGLTSDGTAREYDKSKNNASSGCPSPAKTAEDFECWVAYEHESNTYLSLLGAPTFTVPEPSSEF